VNLVDEPLPLSLLNDYLYCPRRAGLKVVEGWREANAHTLTGDLHHRHADLPGFEHRAGWKLLRALPVWSDALRLSGKADIVEVREAAGRIAAARPVEYKSGRKSKWLNDHVQLCAQAMCLEEMLGIAVPEGLIFHAKSHLRTAVALDAPLRAETRRTAQALHALLAKGRVPDPVFTPRCDGCSLRSICLPEIQRRRFSNLFTCA
jgi:CRISPR-associated exonuclease Cas4